MGEIWLIRHGQASFGAADYDRLSELGFEQSRRLGRWLADSGQRFDLAVTGSHRRHRETMESCLDALNSHCARIEDSGLDEYNHREMLSRYEPGLATPQAVREFIEAQSNPRRAFQELFTSAFARWIGGKHDAEYRESFTGFRRRCLEAFHLRIGEAGRSERIIIFTSGGPIAIIAQSVLGLPDDRVAALNFSLVNAAVTTFFFGSSGLTLSMLNSFQHLEGSPSGRLVTYR